MSTSGDDPPKSRAANMNWLSDNKSKVKKSKKHETRVATQLGGFRTARSGGTAWSKYDRGGDYGASARTAGRDITTPDMYIEHKYTEKQSMSLKLDWLEKVSKAAASGLKDPAVVLTFESDMVGSQYKTCEQDWILIPMSVYQRLKKSNSEVPDGSK